MPYKSREKRLAYLRAYYHTDKDRRAKYEMLNKDKIKERKQKYDTLQRRLRSRQIAKLKDRPCMDCNQCFPDYVMEFDHVRGVKKFNIAIYTGRSWTSILEEIAKCDVVCSNCHQMRTWHYWQTKKRGK